MYTEATQQPKPWAWTPLIESRPLSEAAGWFVSRFFCFPITKTLQLHNPTPPHVHENDF